MLASPSFDTLLLRVFVNALGIYPVGSLVELSTGEVAIVTGPPLSPEALDRPRVRVVKGGAIDPETEIDLASAAEGPQIVKALPPGAAFADAVEHVAAL
jgi:hypothetical protein